MTLIEASKQSGIKYHTLWHRVKKQGMTIEEAVSKEIPDYKQIRELYKHAKVNYRTVCKRLYSYGYSLTEALTLPKYPGKFPTYVLYYNRYKKSAEKRGYQFELTSMEFAKLIASPCEYCYCFEAGGVDRVDNTKGYILDNCVPCCTKCNMMKHTMDKDEFINHCKTVAAANPAEQP